MPQRVNAALGLNPFAGGKFGAGGLGFVLRPIAFLVVIASSVNCDDAYSLSLVKTCSDTVAEVWKKSDSILWVTGPSSEDRIWVKRGAEPKVLVSPPEIPKACTYLAFVDSAGKQFLPCVGWARGFKVPSESILVSRALVQAETCYEECTAKLSDDIFVAYGTARAGNPINLSVNGEQRREWMLEALEREREAFPEFETRLDESGLPDCFIVTAGVLRAVLSDKLP